MLHVSWDQPSPHLPHTHVSQYSRGSPTFGSLLSIGGIGSTHKGSSSRTQQRQIDKHSLNKDYSNGKIKINEYAGQELMCSRREDKNNKLLFKAWPCVIGGVAEPETPCLTPGQGSWHQEIKLESEQTDTGKNQMKGKPRQEELVEGYKMHLSDQGAHGPCQVVLCLIAY